MAPVTANHQEAQESVKNVIQDLLNLMVQVSQFDTNPSSSNNNTPTNSRSSGGGGGQPSSRDIITQSLQTLDASLLNVYRTATLLPSSPSSPRHHSATSTGQGTTELERAEAAQFASTFSQTHNPYAPHLHQPGPQNPGIPIPLITYVENGRNPDVYTREFIELVRRNNQLMRGKMHAFRDFRDILAGEMEAALSELKEDVRRVVEATGGPGPAEGSEERAKEGQVASLAAGAETQQQGGGQQGGGQQQQ